MVIDSSAQLAGIAIKLAIAKPHFRTTELIEESNGDVGLPQAIEVLEQLEQDGWIDRSEQSELDLWKSGSLALEYGDMVKFSAEFEGTIPVLPDERPNRDSSRG